MSRFAFVAAERALTPWRSCAGPSAPASAASTPREGLLTIAPSVMDRQGQAPLLYAIRDLGCYAPGMDTPAALAIEVSDVLPALWRGFRVRRLDLFGLAVDGGRFDQVCSDLDFLVTFEDMPSAAYAEAYFSLREGLAGLFGPAVDLVTEPALENLYLRHQVEAQRRLYPPA